MISGSQRSIARASSRRAMPSSLVAEGLLPRRPKVGLTERDHPSPRRPGRTEGPPMARNVSSSRGLDV